MSSETTYFCDHCERVIEGAKIALQITVDVPGVQMPGGDAHNFVTGQRFEVRTIHFHPDCAELLLEQIQETSKYKEIPRP